MSAPAVRYVVPALVLGQLAGVIDLAIQSVWISSCVRSQCLATGTVGTLASLEQILAAACTLVTAALLPRLNPARIAPLAALVAGLANIVAILPMPEALFAGRVLAGGAVGVLGACVIGMVSRRSDVVRVMAYSTGAIMLLGAGIFFLLPIFGVAGGAVRLFAVMAVIDFAAALALWRTLRPEPQVAREASPAQARPATLPWTLAPALGCLGYAAFGAGAGTVGSYVLVIGQKLEFGLQSIGLATGIGGFFTLLGPAMAHRLGERAGLLGPIVSAYLLIALCWLLLVHAPSIWVFGSLSALSSAAMAFAMPFVVAILGRLDSSGRAAGSSAAFMMIGASTGPKIGSTILEHGSFQILGYIGACFAVLAAAFFAAAASRHRRLTAESDDASRIDKIGLTE
jgi:predicted MFS family arabinose efflux permease